MTHLTCQRSPFLTQLVRLMRRRRSFSTGDDPVSFGDQRVVGQRQHAPNLLLGESGEAVVAGSGVEFGDEVAGGCDQDRVGVAIVTGAVCGHIGCPGGVGLVSTGSEVADVDAAAVGVERDRRRVAFAQREGGCRFGVVEAPVAITEAVHLAESDGADLVDDVAQHATGSDRGELPVVTDQPDLAAAGGDVVDRGRQIGGGGHACLVDQDEGLVVDLLHPGGCPAVLFWVLGVPDELGQRVGADLLPTRAPGSAERSYGLRRGAGVAGLGVDGGAEFLGCDRGGGEADDGAAGVLPRAGEDLHGGGLAGAGGCEGELDGAAAGGHLTDQGLLGGIEVEPG